MGDADKDSWLPAIENVEVQSATGSLWPDGWISREVSLSCVALVDLSGIELQGWNPDWCAVYANNVVTLTVNGEQAQTSEMYMGELAKLRVEHAIAAGGAFVIRVSSAVARAGDALDARERGIVLAKLVVLVRKED